MGPRFSCPVSLTRPKTGSVGGKYGQFLGVYGYGKRPREASYLPRSPKPRPAGHARRLPCIGWLRSSAGFEHRTVSIGFRPLAVGSHDPGRIVLRLLLNMISFSHPHVESPHIASADGCRPGSAAGPRAAVLDQCQRRLAAVGGRPEPAGLQLRVAGTASRRGVELGAQLSPCQRRDLPQPARLRLGRLGRQPVWSLARKPSRSLPSTAGVSRRNASPASIISF